MRRLVKHAIAGFGATALVVAVGVSTLNGHASPDVLLAVPAADAVLVNEAAPAASSAVDAVGADRGAGVERATRDARRVRIVAAAAAQRAASLSAQKRAVARQGAAIRAARARAAAAAAKAEAAARAKAKVQARAEAKAKARVAAKANAAAKAKVAAKARRPAVSQQGSAAGVTDPREIARQLLKTRYSYGSDQYACFDYIIMRESQWSVTATNPGSGAYGIPQALPGSKMATVAPDWRTNPATQIVWGVDYMKSRYGSPCGAKAFRASHGWY